MKETAGDVVIIDPLSQHDWNDLLLSNAGSTIFHSANWAQVLAESYGFKPRYFTLFDCKEIKGCVPVMDVRGVLNERRGVSLSFSDYCGSLVDGHASFSELFKSIVGYGKQRGWRFVEFRGEKYLEGKPPSQRWIHHEVQLDSDEDAMHSRLRKNNAASIKKSVREGVEISFTTSLQGVRDYYRLHCLTRRRHGVPPQPVHFFEELHDHIISQGLGFTALASHRGNTIAGLVCLRFGKNAVYKYGASDDTFQQLRPTNLLLWETMKKCAQEGCKSFSMGRTHPDQEGLLFFKSSWGAAQTPMDYHRYDLSTGAFCTPPHTCGPLLQKIMKRLPLAVLKRLGNLYKYAG